MELGLLFFFEFDFFYQVDSYNNVFEKKIEKYKNKIKEINQTSAEKEKEFKKKMSELENLLVK